MTMAMAGIFLKSIVALAAAYITLKMFKALRSGEIRSGAERDGIVVERRRNPLTFCVVFGIHLFALIACVWWISRG